MFRHAPGKALCPHCGIRPIANALWVNKVGRPQRGVAPRPAAEMVLGCTHCLRRHLWAGIRSLGRIFRTPFFLLLLPPAMGALLLNASWWLWIEWAPPTAWLRAALAQAAIPYEDVVPYEPRASRPALAMDQRVRLARAQILLLRSMIFADGRADPKEVAAARSFLRFFWSTEPEVFEQADPGPEPGTAPRQDEVERACAVVRELLEPRLRWIFLHMLLGVAEQSGGVVAPELRWVQQIAAACGIPARETARAAATFLPPESRPPPREPSVRSGPKHDDPWSILGVPRGASRGQIRTAYRRLVKKHHPDLAAHLGPAMEAEANRRMKRINAAYSRLAKG